MEIIAHDKKADGTSKYAGTRVYLISGSGTERIRRTVHERKGGNYFFRRKNAENKM